MHLLIVVLLYHRLLLRVLTGQVYNEWVNVTVSYQGCTVNINALVVKGCDYKFLLSRPDMEILKLNLY